jgi:hypothetical protein
MAAQTAQDDNGVANRSADWTPLYIEEGRLQSNTKTVHLAGHEDQTARINFKKETGPNSDQYHYRLISAVPAGLSESVKRLASEYLHKKQGIMTKRRVEAVVRDE